MAIFSKLTFLSCNTYLKSRFSTFSATAMMISFPSMIAVKLLDRFYVWSFIAARVYVLRLSTKSRDSEELTRNEVSVSLLIEMKLPS